MSTEADTQPAQRGAFADTIRVIIHALILAMVVRIFFYQPFNIPSGSMKPTLLVGDYLFVSKLSYGYSRYTFPFGLNLFSGRVLAGEPKRGDVVVFKLPSDGRTDYIKRVIGLPGDRIQMRRGQLFIQPKGSASFIAVPKRRVSDFVTRDEFGRTIRIPRYEETLPGGAKHYTLDAIEGTRYDDTGVFEVPPGHYFMMGDNRDNSTDSRVPETIGGVGFVPRENLIGRAELIFFSAEESWRFLKLWEWPSKIRWKRFFTVIR